MINEREHPCGCISGPLYLCTTHRPEDDTDTPKPVYPHEQVTAADIAAGRPILRYTAETSPAQTKVRAWVPCHDGQSVTVPAVDTRSALGGRSFTVRCRKCSHLWTLATLGNIDEGYTAHWHTAPDVQILDTTSRYGAQI